MMGITTTSIALIEAFVKADKPVGAVCHAPAALVNARKGRRVSGQARDRVAEEVLGRTFFAGRPAKGTG